MKKTLAPNMLKCCFVSLYPPTKDGVADYSHELVRNLVTNFRDRLSVIVVANKTYDACESDSHILRAWQWPVKKKYHEIIYLFTVLRSILAIRPDVIHIQFKYTGFGGPISTALAPLLFFLLKVFVRKPIIITLHDIIPTWELDSSILRLYAVNIPTFIVRIGMICITRLIGFLTNLIIVHNRFAKNVLTRNYKVPSTKICIIPHGRSEVHALKSTINSKGALSSDQKFLLFFGFLAPYKGVDLLIRSFKSVLNKYPNTRLIIAGENHPRLKHDYKTELMNFVNTLNLEKNVLFLGYVPDEDVPKVFYATDVVVLPYLACVGASGVLKKAQSFSKPIIVSDLLNLHNSINDNNCIIVPAGDVNALTEAICTIMQKVGSNTYYKTYEDRWDVVSYKIFGIYTKLVAK